MAPLAEPVGHEAVRQTLRALAEGRARDAAAPLQHAWIFSGAPGVGKFRVARWWASLLKCPDLGRCGPDCQSCRLVANAVHPDVFETGPAPKARGAAQSVDADVERKKSVGVEESRALLDRLSLRPVRPGPRIAIVREAGTMTLEAQNALLKLLEEPPGAAVIVLVSDSIGSMLPTVRSRCRHLAFGALSEAEVAQVLRGLGKGEDEAAAAAACSRGSVQRALAYDAEGLADREQLLLAWEALAGDPSRLDDLVQQMLARKEAGYALPELLEWQLAKAKAAVGRAPDEPSPELARVLGLCEAAKAAALLREAGEIRRAMDDIARNASARIVIRDLLLNVRA